MQTKTVVTTIELAPTDTLVVRLPGSNHQDLTIQAGLNGAQALDISFYGLRLDWNGAHSGKLRPETEEEQQAERDSYRNPHQGAVVTVTGDIVSNNPRKGAPMIHTVNLVDNLLAVTDANGDGWQFVWRKDENGDKVPGWERTN